jgi:predicted TIM-barrel fold metal-dependent hydrolase
MIFSAGFFGSRLEQLAMLAARHRVPASYQLGDSPPDHAELIGAEEMQRIIARGEDAEITQIVELQNEKLAALCASRPDRFAAFASQL